jgi:hypothetical protein
MSESHEMGMIHHANARINDVEYDISEIKTWITKACGGIKPIPTEAQIEARKRSNIKRKDKQKAKKSMETSGEATDNGTPP